MDTANVPKFTGLIRKVKQISTNKSAKLTELKSHLIIMIYNKYYIFLYIANIKQKNIFNLRNYI